MTIEPAEYVIGHLHDAFASDPRVSDPYIQAALSGNRVFITGKVPTAARKESISAVAAEIAPDYEIHNQVTVLEPGDTSDPEEMN